MRNMLEWSNRDPTAPQHWPVHSRTTCQDSLLQCKTSTPQCQTNTTYLRHQSAGRSRPSFYLVLVFIHIEKPSTNQRWQAGKSTGNGGFHRKIIYFHSAFSSHVWHRRYPECISPASLNFTTISPLYHHDFTMIPWPNPLVTLLLQIMQAGPRGTDFEELLKRAGQPNGHCWSLALGLWLTWLWVLWKITNF